MSGSHRQRRLRYSAVFAVRACPDLCEQVLLLALPQAAGERDAFTGVPSDRRCHPPVVLHREHNSAYGVRATPRQGGHDHAQFQVPAFGSVRGVPTKPLHSSFTFALVVLRTERSPPQRCSAMAVATLRFSARVTIL